ncbi:MAG: PAC2 family protein [Nitrospirota bacterium]
MGIRIYEEPRLTKPVMIVGWPGIGNIGLVAVDTLREITDAREFGEIESPDFFSPKHAVIRSGLLESLEFPANRFYYSRLRKNDVIFFIGEEQPRKNSASSYAEGKEAYRLANLVVDVAERFGCSRIFTSGAAVSYIHHTMRSRVWTAPNMKSLVREAAQYPNALLMSHIENMAGQGFISGLNGLLLGVARKRKREGICLMGEIPIYFQGLPIPYPRASRSVLEVFSLILGIEIDFSRFDDLYRDVETQIEDMYHQIPADVKKQLDRLKESTPADAELEPMTEENRRRLWKEISEFLREGEAGDEGA